MRFKLLSVLAVLLLVGSNDARPPKVASPEVAEEESRVGSGSRDDTSWRPIEPRSSSAARSDSRPTPPSGQRELKDLHSMDQSLRTVATQLLNVTNPDEATSGKPKIPKGDLPANVPLLRKPAAKPHNSANGHQQNFDSKTKSDALLVQEINSEISALESMGIGFGRPTNSKFGYFESSHPGQAMAMTEEELERELMSSSTRLITAHKNHPTTTGGISTWILLNSPTTTSKPPHDYNNNNNNDDKQLNVQVRLQTKVTTPVKIFETTLKTDMKTLSTVDKIALTESSTTPMERITTVTKSVTPTERRTTTALHPTSTTEKPVKTTELPKTVQTTTRSSTSSGGSTKNDVKPTSPKPIVMTKKTATSSRPTPKTKLTTPKPANVTSKPMTTKLGKPGQSNKPKTTPPRKPTTKPAAESTRNPSSSKIEKVTFRPVQMITTPKSLVESVERPIFVTKIKTSLAADTKAKTTAAAQPVTTSTVLKTDDTKSNFSDGDLVRISTKTKPQPTKANNVLKVQLKKPVEPPTKIEIEPIKVNAPVLRIEKIEDREKVSKTNLVKSSTPTVLDNSRIDIKFDFNPELTKIDVERSTEAAPSSTTAKRPHKRKKNKIRRRKPTTSAPTSLATVAATQASTTQSTTTVPTSTEDRESLAELGVADNSIQESKVVPESKISANNTKNKKKQVQKPIGTQIYNFLSREVMPSFGMMSLVGLGLGLASYFLYPFGGTVARRNYVVEPNYNYNLDEYGGNYGQNEEEVFSKVLQGMTNNDGKYGGIKDYENNFYRYQHFDGAYTAPQAIRKDPRYPSSSATIYRPLETTVYDTKHRNTEFKYPELPTTPNYYERHSQEYVTKKPAHGDRQFVVGNVPKEYGYADKGLVNLSPTTQAVLPDFERTMAQNHKFAKNPVDISPTYRQPESQALKANEGYEEIEITPAAVAVEHGPRSLKTDLPKLRIKRESVIQLIPSRTDIEKEVQEIEKEEPLSNEILDIIDSVIPENAIDGGPILKTHKDKYDGKKQELEKLAAGNADNKQVDAKDAAGSTVQAAVEATVKAVVPDDKATTEAPPASTPTVEASTSTTTTTTIKSLTIDEILGSTASSDGKDPEDSSVEWLDHSTTEKPHNEPFSVFGFVKKIAEVKLRLGIAILKHASEGFARYLGHVQKRVNGEE